MSYNMGTNGQRLADGMERVADFLTTGAAYHVWVGNDAPPALTALVRAFTGAILSGVLGFLTAWQATDEIKVLVSAGLTPFFSYLGIRFGIEGLVDTAKYNGGKKNGGKV